MMRYQKLGLRREQLDVESHLRGLELDLKQLEKKVDDWYMAMTAISSGSDLLALCHYYYEDLPSARRYAAMTSEYCQEHFFGSWRKEVPIDNDPPSEAVRKRYEPWARHFRNSIMWAMCLGDWRKVCKLSEYPTDECPIGRYETRQECYWLLVLAGVLRGDEAQQHKYFDAVRKCKSKYHRQLLAMTEAILSKDVARYEQELVSHLAHCCEHVFTQPGIDAKISKDATILHHYARHLGLDVTWPQEHADRLISL